MRKRIFSLLVAFAMCLSLIPGVAWAVEDDASDTLEQATEKQESSVADKATAETVLGAKKDEAENSASVIRGEGNTILYGNQEYRIEDGQIYCNDAALRLGERTPYKIALADNTVYAIVGEKEQWVVLDDSLAGEVSLLGNSDNEREIFLFTQTDLGVNTAATCGILANIYAESSFRPTAYVIDTNGLPSYGICQWNGGRYTALQNYCSQSGYDYTTLSGQLQYLKYELTGSESSAFNKVISVPDTAQGAYDAGYNWARYFERCASRYYTARAERARDVYWSEYSTPQAVLLSGNVQTLLDYLNDKVGTGYKSSACQMFVWESIYDCFGRSNTKQACCATKAWQNYGVSSSRDNIPLGAAVYFGGSNVTDSVCGQKAGHVGLYVGDGYIVHAWSGVIRKATIDYVISCGYPYRGWGWQGELELFLDDMPLSISGEVYPTGKLESGSSFGLRGVIRSQYKLTDISAYIYDDSGNVVMEYHHNPNSYSYDIRTGGLNNAFIFGNLSVGYYKYVVQASDSSPKTTILLESTFQIGNPPHNTHVKGAYQWYEAAHPHYHYWKCSICGELFTDGSTEHLDSCSECNPVKNYYLDVNGYLDGSSAGSLGDYGTVDVYINGSRVADDVTDYYAESPSGTSYEIRDIKPKPGYSYDGLRQGARVGAIGSETVNLTFAFSSVDASGVSAPRAEGTFNNHIYLFCDKEVTWYAAKQLCEFMGGHLVTITSEEENQFVHSLRAENRIWLGATHASGSWEWITGETFSYDKWASGEWNNATDNDEGSENYAEQAYWDATWNDLPGYFTRGFVCEIDRVPTSVANGVYWIFSAVDGRSLDVSGARTNQGANIQTWENLGIDSQKFTITKDGDYYTVVALHSGMAMDVEGAVASSGVNVSQCPLNGNNAQKWMFEDAGDGYVYIHSALGCYLDVYGGEAKDGANIWTYFFNGTAAQKFRLELIQNYHLDVNGYLDGASVGSLGDYGTVDIYINGSRVADDVTDYYEELQSGTNYEIKDIKPKAGYSYNGVYGGVRSGVLSSNHAVVLDFSAIQDIEENPERTSFNGHTYLAFNTPVTWYAAKWICENRGGHLATITSAEENAFVRSIITGEFWIGGTDADDEQHWRWVTQEAFSYENWRSGQPDNSISYEVSLTHTGEENHLRVYEDGTWNDISGCLQYPFICEIDDAEVEIMIANKSASRGATVEIPVTIKNNPGISGATLAVSYDKSVLTLTSVTKGAVFENGSYAAYPETGVVQWYHTENVTGDGVLFTLQFAVNGNAQNGSYNIAVGLRDGIPANLSNADSNVVNAQFISGVLEIASGIRGDVTGDGVVAINDVVKVARAVAGNLTLTEAETAMADVTGDGVIAINDVVKLARYVAGNLASLQSAEATSLSGGESAVIEVATVSGKPGETVRVPVSVISNPGIAGAQLDVLFDSGLTLKNIVQGDVLSEGTFNPDISAGRIQWYYDQANVTNTGVLFTLEFEISANAKNGDAYAVTVNVKDGITANLSDYDFNPVNAEFKAGKVQVGDASGNTVIGTVSRNGNTVTANVVCSDSNASVFCGVYNNSGKMIAVRSVQVTSESTYQFQFDGQQFDYAKAFVVDSDFRPLCEGKRT